MRPIQFNVCVCVVCAFVISVFLLAKFIEMNRFNFLVIDSDGLAVIS